MKQIWTISPRQMVFEQFSSRGKKKKSWYFKIEASHKKKKTDLDEAASSSVILHGFVFYFS